MATLLAHCAPVTCCREDSLHTTKGAVEVNPLNETDSLPFGILPQCTSRTLEVPRCFDAGSTSASDGDMSSASKNQFDGDLLLAQARRCFMRSFIQGVQLELLLDDGSSIHVEGTFDFPVTNLVLSVNDVQRSVALDDIERVLGPEEAKEFGTTNHGFLNERCTTLMLRSLHFLTFVFGTTRHREYFQTCFQTLLATRSSSERVASLLTGEDEALPISEGRPICEVRPVTKISI